MGDNDETEDGSILDDGGIDTDERAGRSQGIKPDEEPDEDTRQEMEEERERRLDPDNRPDNVEVDNTQRTFDTEQGMFTDNEDYEEGGDAPYQDPEAPEQREDAGDSEEAEDSEDDS